jgi:hypothetical protein
VEVAVKILRPGTRPLVVLDLFILRGAAQKFFDAFARKNLGCPATLLVDEFAEKLLEAGPAGCCSPHYRVPLNSRDEGSKCVG